MVSFGQVKGDKSLLFPEREAAATFILAPPRQRSLTDETGTPSLSTPFSLYVVTIVYFAWNRKWQQLSFWRPPAEVA